MSSGVAVVTGADGGVGFEVAKSLCEAGNEVILACKDQTLTDAAVDKIKQLAPSAVATCMQVCRRRRLAMSCPGSFFTLN